MTRGQIATILGDLEAVAAMGREILDLCDEYDLKLPRAYGVSLLAEAEFFADGFESGSTSGWSFSVP